ncbi:restriction endonuclease subunit S [Kocuria carniphila]|uniref:restriction endonuclease subunit S n=1 Tax=Kocuria carniphila TaxID=262208 RepID=UPI0034DB05B6
MRTGTPTVPAKRLLQPALASSGLIKGQASDTSAPGLVPAFSASGQDVWVPSTVRHETRPGIVLSAVGAQCGKVFFANYSEWSTVANTYAWTFSNISYPKFVWYLLSTDNFWDKGGAAQPYVKIPESLNKHVFCPVWDDQKKIADYLDHETAEIDAFIEDLRVAADLRVERWRSTRDQALTFGIEQDPASKTRPVTWFGEHRADWRNGPLKRLFKITLGKMLDEKQHADSDERQPYIRAGNIREDGLDLDNLNSMPFSREEQAKFSLRKSDILVVEGGSVGTNVVLDEDLPHVFFQKTVNRMRPFIQCSSHYYSDVLNSYKDRGVFDVVANKSTIQHLTADKLENLLVPIPPVEEQCLIAESLSQARREISELGDEVTRAIHLARERRAALITAAVTGQIDVTARNKPAAEQLEDDIAQGLHKES